MRYISALLLGISHAVAYKSATNPITISTAAANSKAVPPDWARIQCTDGGILPTPTYGDSGSIFTACAQLVIDAPVEQVYNAIIDFGSYPKWNSFVPLVKPRDGAVLSDVRAGLPMTFHSAGLAPFGLNTTTDERVTVLDLPSYPRPASALVVWRFDPALGATLIQAEHPNILTHLHNGSTRYISYETYYSLGSVAVQLLEEAKLKKQFVQQGHDLKAYVERMSA
ncbi:hypothetical protein K437DRAFT_257277 [Tilletiaria anomala UBC 951]|uniref:Coenzyme Q-binding protein COQ10 START domain-containing protein n=1 Tax=Tilletiaria anomala (strain ATCC 24038 / CBS 436.72 / UBC 951) TaxID=1037660 RepID=A0A066VQG5_TILAU|nr:uncharacterized protein K437DRAFT_257277 [Tilletiaria anomala UBC 951]KDN43972.1 hypothetical protein K437DRAFT_257277 [Tilletiaria anomala UBC 951]